MALYLVQHGRSLLKEQDPEQGLSEQGGSEVERIARIAGEYGVKVSLVLHSGKKRALQTAEIFARALNPESGIRQVSGLNPLDDVTRFAGELWNHQNVMIVGHLPFMERLAAYLVMGSTETSVVKFQNGGVVCFDQEPGEWLWFIKWTLMPNID